MLTGRLPPESERVSRGESTPIISHSPRRCHCRCDQGSRGLGTGIQSSLSYFQLRSLLAPNPRAQVMLSVQAVFSGAEL